MKKNSWIALALFLMASCNSNNDQEAAKTPETQTGAAENINQSAEEKIKWPLSGKFEVIDYKKENVQITLPNKVILEFTKKGDVIKTDGGSYYYRIEGDSILFLSTPDRLTYKSKIEFLNSDSTSFVVKTPLDKTELTYKKMKK